MQPIIDFIVHNQAVVAGVVVAFLDLVFAVSKNLQANGILHQVYLWLKAMKDKTPSA